MTSVISVSTLSGLYSALASAKGGETIELAGGEYGNLSLTMKSGFPLKFPSDVTITSADPENPAVFARADVRGAQNLSFDGITFDYSFKVGEPIWTRPFNFSGCEGLTIRNSTFDGDAAKGVSTAADGYGYGIGLGVRFSKDVTLEQNEVSGFHRGISVSESRDITVQGNNVHDMRMDGMMFSDVRNVVIEENWVHDFRTSPNSGDHCDMIQFWTDGTKAATENVIIRGNRLDIGAGDFTQSIFMRNELVDTGRAGTEMFYRNILIEENVITNAHLHGITVGETAGLTIRQNTVLHADGRLVDGPDASVEIPRISVASSSTGVTIQGNATSGLSGHTGQASWLVSNNAFVQDQDPLAPGHYGDQFISSSLAAGSDPVAVDGGMLDQLGAGATLTRSPEGTGEIVPLFHVATTEDDLSLRIFDATATLELSGDLPSGTRFIWDFGDGTSIEGLRVAHRYSSGGEYEVTLTVIAPGAAAAQAVVAVEVSGTSILSLTDTQFMAYENGAAIALGGDDSIDAAGIRLLSTSTAVQVRREHVVDLLGADDFNIDFSMRSDTMASKGEVFRLHGSVLTIVDSKGQLLVQAWTTDKQYIRLESTGIVVNDLKEHDISISYQDDLLSLVIDGKTVASALMTAPLAGLSGHSLVFGNPWGQANFTGLVTTFDISRGEGQFPDVPTSAVLSSHSALVADDLFIPIPLEKVPAQDLIPAPEGADLPSIYHQDLIPLV